MLDKVMRGEGLTAKFLVAFFALTLVVSLAPPILAVAEPVEGTDVDVQADELVLDAADDATADDEAAADDDVVADDAPTADDNAAATDGEATEETADDAATTVESPAVAAEEPELAIQADEAEEPEAEEEAELEIQAVVEPGGVVTGGDTIEANGIYYIAEDATGTIEIGEGLEVTLVGNGFAKKFTGLNIKVGDSTTLTIQDLCADQGNAQSTIDFLGNGALVIEGQNLIDNDGGLNYAVIHVAEGKEVHFSGAGTLYGYKSALCAYIGGNNGEANGAIVFDGGYWFLKGTKTGAVIGGDSGSVKGGDITINGGELYVKGVARGALIGGSNQGLSGDVYVNGGLVELFEDFSGPAIGAGNVANAGNVYVNGGSLKTTLSSNSANEYGQAATFGGMPGVSWDAVKALNADDYALLSFDVSEYVNDLASDTVDVYVDGNLFYSGRAYTYVTNEVKNPTADATFPFGTMANWLPNDESWLVTSDDYGESSYPGKNGSSLVPEKSLYFALAKTNHIITVGADRYSVMWSDETGFTSVKLDDAYDWYLNAADGQYVISSAADLAAFANVVNGTVPEQYGIAQDAFDGATVTLADDLDLSAYEDWAPIGTSSIAFAGTFDGAGKTISGFAITSNGGYKGLFANNAGTVSNFTIVGTYGSEDAYIGTGDCHAGAVAYNTGTVSNVIANVTMFFGSGDTYANGGVVGRNAGGTVSQCANLADIKSDTSKSVYRTGGVVGHLQSGTVTECYNTAWIEAWNYRNGNQGTGGVVGSMDDGNITFCYNTGSSHNGTGSGNDGGKQGSGGIVGASAKGNVTNCYATGNTYGPASSGIIAGKVGTGNYDHLFSLDTARAYQQYGTKTDSDYNNLKYADGTDENADGSIKFGGAALARDYSGGYVITNSYTKSDEALKSAAMVVQLNTLKDGTHANLFVQSADGGYPVLAWQGGTEIQSLELSSDYVTGIEADYVKTDEGISPVVAVAIDGDTLIPDVDYTLSYASLGGVEVTAPFTQPGTYVASIVGSGTGEGGFYGTAEVEFRILPSGDDVVVNPIPDQTYTGSEIEPEVTVSFNGIDGETALIQGQDFALKCDNNVNVGEAAVVIVGSDNVEFSTSATFNIVPKSLKSGFTVADVEDQLATGKQVKPAITLTDDATGAELVEGTDYILTYYNNTAVGTASVKATGQGNYTGSTSSKKFNIVTVNIEDATVASAGGAYTGQTLTPEVTVTVGDMVIPASAYKLTWDGNIVDAGKYTLTVIGDGIGLIGSTTCDYVVGTKPQTVSATDKSVAMGKTVALGAKVSEGAGALTYASSDTAVAKVDASGKITPVKVGTASITITAAAKGNYAKTDKVIKVTVTKGKNPIVAKAKKVKALKAKTLKKKAKTIKTKTAFSVTKAQGKVTYKKANKAGGKKIAIASNGKITLKKGLKKGTYKVKVKVTAAGNANYNKATKTVTVKVVVK